MSRTRRIALLTLALPALTGCGAAAATVARGGSTARARTHAARTAPTRTAPAHTTPPHTTRPRTAPARTPTAATTTTAAPPPTGARRAPFGVGERTLTFVDHSRTVRIPGHRIEPRTLVTVVRYPAIAPAAASDVPNAPADRAAGPFGLVVFGHGFAVTPATYFRLLRAWARAGYVVAAPVFPLENAHAPGGPDESDLDNQPQDMSDVITGMLAQSHSATGPLAGMLDPARIAVAGQSDGGETALAVAYDRVYRDPRVRAAVILSGAEIPDRPALQFGPGAPALLASQGTADTINLPHFTNQFFAAAGRPKYLLTMLGAQHLPPYTFQQPQLTIVEQVSTAFLDLYLRRAPGAAGRLRAAGNHPGVTTLTAEP